MANGLMAGEKGATQGAGPNRSHAPAISQPLPRQGAPTGFS